MMALRPTTPLPKDRRGRGVETGSAESLEGALRKTYRIILRIRHPELDPAVITASLGWKPDRSWKAGDQAITPKGTKLPSLRSDGLWSRTFSYEGEQCIADNLDKILDRLLTHKPIFQKLNRLGAQSALYLQLPGEINIGDSIPWGVLKKFADLRISFELETFPG
jgi:hypothetical protein